MLLSDYLCKVIRCGDARSQVEAPIDKLTIYSTQRAGAVLLTLAGMAMQWAALHTITFLGTVFDIGDLYGFDAAWLANSLTTFITFAIFYVLSKRFNSLFSKNFLVLTIGCLFVGVLAFMITLFFPAALYVGNAVIALGTTILILMWGEIYSYLNPRGEQLLVTLVAIVLSVILYLVEVRLPRALAIGMFVVMLSGSVACLWRVNYLFGLWAQMWGTKNRAPVRKSPALLLVCIVVFSIPYSYLGGSDAMEALLGDIWSWSGVLSVVVVVMLAVCLVECVVERVGRVLMPVMVLALLSAAMMVHLFVGSSPFLLMPSLLYAGYYLFLAMVYLALGPIVAMTDANPLRLFSGAMQANVGGLLAGSLLGSLSVLMTEHLVSLLVIGLAYCILFTGFALWRGRSYSIFRVNSFDEEHYSFEYLSPLPASLKSTDAAPASRPAAPNASRPEDPASKDALACPIDSASDSMCRAITAQCLATGARYGLSVRETQVLVELVRGRTIASIAEELVISENTVKAHTKSIYRKLGVHTREALAACVEQA